MSLPESVVGDAYASTYHWDLLCDLVDIDNRMAGQEGEHEGAALVAEALEDVGASAVETTAFDIPGWWRGDSGLTVEAAGRDHAFDGDYQTIALPGSPSGDVEAELVDVGPGRPEDFDAVDVEGKIVVASSATPDSYGRWIHRGEKYGFAVEGDAAAFVFRNHYEGALPPTGSIGNAEGPGAIPAVGVSKEVGDRLVRYCDDGTVEAELAVDARNEPSSSRNVEGVFGPDTDEEVLVTGHVDGHDIAEGARDNGTGTVLAVEVGRLLKQVEDDLDTRVRVLVVGAEEVGLFGSYHWAETHPEEQVKATVNLDGVGYSRDLDVYTHRFDEIGEAFEAAAEDLGVPVEVSDGIRPHSDHWPFVQRGVPGCQARSITGDSGRGWGHTHADTLDKLDVRDFRDLSVVLAAGVKEIASADCDVEHKPVSEIREATIEDGHEEGMRNSDGWPWPFEDGDAD
jgi:Zn-dependent M28 family amino/carboxypeptidase